jgi:hypothetical protein
MNGIPLTAVSTNQSHSSTWSLANLFRALLRTRREVKRLAALAERERLEMGYQRVPSRVWARRSALFIDL